MVFDIIKKFDLPWEERKKKLDFLSKNANITISS